MADEQVVPFQARDNVATPCEAMLPDAEDEIRLIHALNEAEERSEREGTISHEDVMRRVRAWAR
ncbi:MAG: hypothetical protein ACKVVT_06835 [Dehalococcoidia bacterium]